MPVVAGLAGVLATLLALGSRTFRRLSATCRDRQLEDGPDEVSDVVVVACA